MNDPQPTISQQSCMLGMPFLMLFIVCRLLVPKVMPMVVVLMCEVLWAR